jgi:hypothetical protein
MTDNRAEIIIEENESGCVISCNNMEYDSLIEFLIEEEFDFIEKDDTIEVLSGIEEVCDAVSEYDLEVFHPSLLEGIAKRKYVVRAGKRKVIFKCKPGEKRFGRSCRKIPSSQLQKIKRRARRGARKARSKRMRANRRRKSSIRKRTKTNVPRKMKPAVIKATPKPTSSKIKRLK